MSFERSSEHASVNLPGSNLDFSAVGGPKPRGPVKAMLEKIHTLLIGR